MSDDLAGAEVVAAEAAETEPALGLSIEAGITRGDPPGASRFGLSPVEAGFAETVDRAEPKPVERTDEDRESAARERLGDDFDWAQENWERLGPLIPDATSTAEAEHNVRVTRELRAGWEAQQVAHEAEAELDERDRADALAEALERFENRWDVDDDEDVEDAAEIAAELLAEAPDRLAEFVEAWAEEEPDEAAAWAAATRQQLVMGQAWGQEQQQQQAAEAARQAHDHWSETVVQAGDDYLTKNKVDEATAGLMAEMINAHPEVVDPTSPELLEGTLAGLHRSAREVLRAEQEVSVRNAIMRATPDLSIDKGLHSAREEPNWREVLYPPAAAPTVRGRNVTGARNPVDNVDAIKTALRTDPISAGFEELRGRPAGPPLNPRLARQWRRQQGRLA